MQICIWHWQGFRYKGSALFSLPSTAADAARRLQRIGLGVDWEESVSSLHTEDVNEITSLFRAEVKMGDNGSETRSEQKPQKALKVHAKKI